jgi:hypothetical protein
MQLGFKQLMLYLGGIVALLMFLMLRFLGFFSAIVFSWNCLAGKTTMGIYYAFCR